MNQRSVLQDSLIKYLEKEDSIDSRFTDVKCMSFVENQVRQGSLSLVFTAFDIAEQVPVIIKVHDPDHMHLDYRIAAFKREPLVLSRLQGNKRCLQLVFGPGTFTWVVDDSGSALPFQLGYFVAEWIPEEVDQYFIDHRNYSALEKIKVFKSAVLALASIHRSGIMHRDIKADNLRARIDESSNLIEVIPIDFGTAVHKDDPTIAISSEYPDTVGALAFSAPEAYAGLRSDREVGALTDIYAMGALLYKLFNDDHYYYAAVDRNVRYQQTRAYMSAKLSGTSSYIERRTIWEAEMPGLRSAVIPPEINSRGSSLPSSISQIMVPLHKKMVLFDFQERVQSLEYVVSRLNIAIRVLENQQLENAINIRKRKLWKLRNEKQQLKQARLDKYMDKTFKVGRNV